MANYNILYDTVVYSSLIVKRKLALKVIESVPHVPVSSCNFHIDVTVPAVYFVSLPLEVTTLHYTAALPLSLSRTSCFILSQDLYLWARNSRCYAVLCSILKAIHADSCGFMPLSFSVHLPGLSQTTAADPLSSWLVQVAWYFRLHCREHLLGVATAFQNSCFESYVFSTYLFNCSIADALFPGPSVQTLAARAHRQRWQASLAHAMWAPQEYSMWGVPIRTDLLPPCFLSSAALDKTTACAGILKPVFLGYSNDVVEWAKVIKASLVALALLHPGKNYYSKQERHWKILRSNWDPGFSCSRPRPREPSTSQKNINLAKRLAKIGGKVKKSCRFGMFTKPCKDKD